MSKVLVIKFVLNCDITYSHFEQMGFKRVQLVLRFFFHCLIPTCDISKKKKKKEKEPILKNLLGQEIIHT